MSTLTRTVLEATSGLAASPVSAVAINLTWAANTRATGYRVYRNGTLIGSPTANSYSDSGLTASTSYTYSVSTVAASGEGPQTAGVQGTTLAAPDTTAPTAPVITATATGQTTISVALTTPATDAQSGVASYDLDYKTAAAGTYTTITPVTAGQFPYIIGGLSAATTHNTRARARDTVGNIGAYSAVSNATTQAATGTSYPWYPALDLSTIPFHNAAGPWGPQFPIQAPTAPSFSGTTVNLSVAGQGYNFFSPTPGTRYVVAANVGSINFSGTITDIELVIPSGFSTGQLTIGGTINRFRARGSTVGAHSGGQVFRIDLSNGGSGTLINDVIFDGFKIGSSIEAFGYNIVQSDVVNRFCVVNCKMRAVRSTFIGTGRQVVWAGNSIQSGVYSVAQTTGTVDINAAQWSIRHGTEGPVVLFQNDIRGRKYHRFRTGANTPAEAASTYHYIAENQIVDEQESAITLVLGATTSPCTIITNNDIYAYEAGGGARFNAEKANYARITNNRIRSNSITASYLNSQRNSHLAGNPSADVDFSTGNTFAGWSRPATWRGAGDPSDVVLPGGAISDSVLHAADFAGLAP